MDPETEAKELICALAGKHLLVGEAVRLVEEGFVVVYVCRNCGVEVPIGWNGKKYGQQR